MFYSPYEASSLLKRLSPPGDDSFAWLICHAERACGVQSGIAVSQVVKAPPSLGQTVKRDGTGRQLYNKRAYAQTWLGTPSARAVDARPMGSFKPVPVCRNLGKFGRQFIKKLVPVACPCPARTSEMDGTTYPEQAILLRPETAPLSTKHQDNQDMLYMEVPGHGASESSRAAARRYPESSAQCLCCSLAHCVVGPRRSLSHSFVPLLSFSISFLAPRGLSGR